MKAIIVIDLNDTTLKEWDTDTSKCWAEIKVHTPIKGGAYGIGCVYSNDNVELKPMPTQVIDRNTFAIENKYMNYQDGYNACIDEILGGNDE